ncbi:MAG: PAS domain S-box protein [Bacteroidetes bacterium]|nr:PAS domain S-box protein [Bacteroidota bacterium]
MVKCFLTVTLFLIFFSQEISAQHTPLDRCVRDSLFLVMPHDNTIQQAIIYLELAELIKDKLPQKSFSYIVSAFRISILEKNDSLKALVRMSMGDHYTTRHNLMHAYEQYVAAWKTYELISDTAGQIIGLLKISSTHRSLTNYGKALECLRRGMALAQKSKDQSLTGRLYCDLGITYQAMGDRVQAADQYSKALAIFQLTGEKNYEGWVQNNIGTLYLDEGRFDEGLAFYLKLLPASEALNLDLKGSIYTRIGHIYSKKHDYRNSLKYNLKALVFRQRNGEVPVIISSLINIAGDYYNLNKPDSGKPYMDSGLMLAKRFDLKNLLENAYRHLYSYYLNQGDYKMALEYYAHYSAVVHGMNMDRNRNNIAILEANQRLQRIEQSGLKIARQHDIQALNLKYHGYQSVFLQFMMGLAALLVLVFILLLLYLRQVRRKMQRLNVQLSEEVGERKATEEQTRDRESKYKFITDHSVDFITHIDSQKKRIYASPASVTVYGYEQDEIIQKSPYDLTLPDHHALMESQLKEMIESRSSRQFVYQAQKKDGSVFWVESILNPLFDPISGDFKGMVGVTRDIQERKTKELEIMEGTKQKENLLKEIHHRVKNNFAILVSLINMQMAQTKNEELLQSLTNLQLRIRTMSLVHEMLYRSGDFEKISFPGYIRSLASVVAGTYNRREIELSIEADEVVMDIEASIPLGLIINEILSNAYKHGFPDHRAGKIEIRFTMNPDNGISKLVLRDDGIGMPNGVSLDRYKSMGLQVVQILCAQIEGELVVDNNPGASFTLTFQSA